MTLPLPHNLSRRERQIMDILYRLGEGSVADVVTHISDQPAYNSIRVTLGILEKKGFLAHRKEGQRYIYTPVVSQEKATQTALSHLTKTFFGGSPSQAILTMLDLSFESLSEDELDQLAQKIELARMQNDPNESL